MRVTATTTGIDAIKKRMATLVRARDVTGEVYWSGQRNVDLGTIHAHGAPGRNLPARNPYFVPRGVAERVTRTLHQGVDALVVGRSKDLLPFMQKASDTVRDTFRRNIAPDGRLAAEHVGLHEPAGRTIGEGTKMARLNRDYRASKLKAVGPKPILVRTGELRDSIRSRVKR